MKKNGLILLALLLTFSSIFAMDIEIGNGTTTTSYLPVYGYYDYSWSNFIIDANLIGMEVEINQIQFNVSNTPAGYETLNQKIYFKHTTDAVVPVAYPNPVTAGFTMVYDGAITWDGNGWQGVMLDTPFEYNGTDNLQIVWENWDGTYVTGYPSFYTTDLGTNVSAYKYQDGDFPAVDGTNVTYFPNLKLSFDAENEPTIATLVAPAHGAVNVSTTTSLEWTLGENTTDVDVYFSDVAADVATMAASAMVIDGQNVTSYQATGLETLTSYFWRVKSRNSANDLVVSSPVWSFTTEAGGGIVAVPVGNGTTTANQYPWNFYYKNSVAETIYLAEELNIGGQMQGLTYYNNFVTDLSAMPVNIWIGETTQTDLSAYIPASQLTAVFSGNVDFPVGQNNINITFDTPYNYAGGNLVVLTERVLDTEYYSSSDKFFNTATELTARTISWQSDSIDFDPNAMEGGTTVANMPNVTFYFITEGMGSVTGTVTDGTTGLAGVNLVIDGTNYQTMSTANGSFEFPYVAEGEDYTLTASLHGYNNGTATFDVVEDQETIVNVTMAMLDNVEVSGQVITNDTGAGIQAHVTLTGYENYEVDTDANGYFTIAGVFSNQTYAGTATAVGYQPGSFQAVVADIDLDLGTILVTETLFPASNVVATLAGDDAVVTWEAPNPNAGESIQEGFEESFPPANWNTVVTNTTQSWVQYETVTFSTGDVVPTEGMYQAGVMWDYGAQDEWLITNSMNCPAGNLTFDFYGQYGSEYGDNYYVKVSTDGTNWTPIWNASDLPVAENHYDTPIVIDLSAYAGQNVQFAWNFVDGDGQGLWYASYIDNVNIGGRSIRTNEFTSVSKAVRTANVTKFNRNKKNPNEAAAMRVATNNTRSFEAYNVYRFLIEDEANMANWTLVEEETTALTYTDTDWSTLPVGFYKYAVKAVYTNGAEANAVISNWLQNSAMSQVTVNVESNLGDLVADAVVNLMAQTPNPDGEYDEYEAVTDASGTAVISVNTGVYDMTVIASGFSIYETTVDASADVTVDVTVNELALPPSTVVAEQTDANAVITWSAPSGNGGGEASSESFEESFPPTDWTTVVNNTTQSWVQYETVTFSTGDVVPTEGMYQAGVMWDYGAQDEWLITGEMACPAGNLVFDFYGQYGSEYGDNYYVKISTDGSTWTPLWNASDLPAGENHYDAPIVIDLSAYAGQNVQIAWQFVDGDGQGLWYATYIDNITFGGERISSTDLVAVSRANKTVNNIAVKNTPKNRDKRNANEVSGRISPAVYQPQVQTNLVRVENRALLGYKVWRFLSTDQGNEANWTLLTTNMITELTYTDTSWDALASGSYKFAVKAVYTNDNMSPAAFSNVLLKDMYGTVDGTVAAEGGAPINGASVTLDGNTITTDASGYFIFTEVLAGVYDITASAAGYVGQTQSVTVIGTQLTSVDFTLAASDILISDDFESYSDFALEAGPWTLIDGDLSTTYGFQGVSFDNSGSPMSYIVFNPAMTTPPLEEDANAAHSGTKYLACFASTTPTNNDWMITPEFTLGASGSFNFWGKSVMDDYGLERFNVLVSNGSTNPNDFTSISGATYVEAPIEWTEYSYSLDAYANQTIRVAIQCVSNDAFIFMVDDVAIDAPGGTDIPSNDIPAVSQLVGNYPNPFNPETTIAFSTKENGPVSIDIYNIKGQKVKALVSENMQAGPHTVVWNGTDDNGKNVASGVFFYRMKSGKYTSTKKMILMK